MLTVTQQQFINTWGSLGANWGINKTMAQIHALLLASVEALSTEDIMMKLSISRGNANMNVRNLVDWGLAHKVTISGDRKDFYEAKKDIWVIAKRIADQRRRKELSPLLNAIGQLKESAVNDEDKALVKQIKEMEDFALNIDRLLDQFVKSDRNKFYNLLLKMI